MQQEQPSDKQQKEQQEVLQTILKITAKHIVLAELMTGMYASEYLEIMEMKSVDMTNGGDKSRWFVLCVSDTHPDNNPLFNKSIYQ